MGKKKILVVDDHPKVRNAVCALLSTLSDWTVCGEAADGIEAVEQARALHPDLVVMDVSMPRMDGVEATRAIRSEFPNIEVIIISQNDPKLFSRQATEGGARAFIAKAELAYKLLPAIQEIVPASGRQIMEPASSLLAAIVDSSDDAIVSKNLDGIITSWNLSAERIFGYTAAEALGQHVTLIIPEDRWDEETLIMGRLRRGERVDHFRTLRRRKDGTTLDVSLTISPVRDDSGQVIGASKVARDITAQRRAEQALRETEERLRAIIETTPECVKMVARDGTLLLMNSPGLHMIGAGDPEMAVGKSVYCLIASEHRDKYREFNERICDGERGSLAFDMVGLKGTRHNMETHAAPFRSPDGSCVQLAITHDVTDRKRAEEREREITAETVAATAKFRAVFEQTTQFAGITSTDGRVIDANRLCLEACGYRLDDVLGKLFWETPWWRNFPESQEKIRAATSRVVQGIPYREILQYSLANGDERLVDFSFYPIVDDNNNVLFLHPTGVDITEAKRTEENYRRLAESLEAEVRARTVLLEKRSVEVLRQSELLREFSRRLLHAQDKERRHIARELHDSAGQTLTVLGMDIVQLIQKAEHIAPELAAETAKIEQSVQQLQREIRTTSYLLHPPLLDETGLSSALGWYVQGLEERSGLDISLAISDEVGRLPRDMELAIFRIVQECLTNIHRHSGSKTARISMTRSPASCCVLIEDQGSGISPDKISEIQSGGAGVGIRGMRERLRQFDGNLHMESDESGTRVMVTIPVARDILDPPDELGIKPTRAAV